MRRSKDVQGIRRNRDQMITHTSSLAQRAGAHELLLERATQLGMRCIEASVSRGYPARTTPPGSGSDVPKSAQN